MPNGAFAYVASAGVSPDYEMTVSVIDTLTNAVITTIPLGPGVSGGIAIRPNGIAIKPDGAFAYVSYGGYRGAVAVIDTSTNTVTATIETDNYPAGLAVTSDGTWLYVATRETVG